MLAKIAKNLFPFWEKLTNLIAPNTGSMQKKKELLIFDHPLKMYTHLGLPPDCINDKDEFSILNFGDFALPLPYTSPSFRAH